uniref:BI1-like protein n=1 Tax=Fragaria vesca subsp. vesca TaxID=101020 RepID=UPI0005C85546|nr:PREDICTED: BI1-like protein [Fragaria vesca subsp. vesca]
MTNRRNLNNKHQWSSGRIVPCHATDPGSIPGWCISVSSSLSLTLTHTIFLFKVIRDEPGLYPSMTENPALRWAFIRKGYTILTVQLLLTATVVLVRPVTLFFVDTYAGLSLLIADFVLALAVVVALRFCGKKYPVNFILMGLFTVLIGVTVEMHCVFTEG